jgi:tetratricopeptide (TPR) repeat protein
MHLFNATFKKRVVTVSAIALLCACGGSSFVDASSWIQGDSSSRHAEKKIPQPPSYTSISGQYLSALIARKTGQEPDALGYINKAIGLSEPNQELYLDAYSLALQAGNIDLAISYADKMSNPKGEAILSPNLLKAVQAIKAQDYKKASKHLNASTENGFGFLVVNLLKAWVDAALDKQTNVQGLAKLAEQGGEFQLLLNYQLGLLQQHLGKEELAKKHLDYLIAFPELPYHMKLRLANFYREIGDQETLLKLEQVYQDRSGANEMAYPPLEPLTVAGGAAEVFYGVSSLLISVNALDTADVPLYVAQYLTPEQSSFHFLQAQLAQKKGETALAEEYYHSLKKDKFYGFKSAFQLAYIYQDQGDLEKALEEISQLAETAPDNMRIWLVRGDLLRGSERYEEAIDAYSEAIEISEKSEEQHWPAYYARAVAYERAGFWHKAENDFLEALRLEPDQPDVLNYLGYSWLAQNRQVSQAKAMIEKAIKARPRDAHIIDSMGWAYYRLGEYEKAADYLERAISLSPADATVNEHLGDAYWRLGLETQARFQWQRALALEPSEKGQFESIEQKLAEGLPVEEQDVSRNRQTAEDQKSENTTVTR